MDTEEPVGIVNVENVSETESDFIRVNPSSGF